MPLTDVVWPEAY